MSGVDDCVQRLVAELADCVHRPGRIGYRMSLGRVFFPDAARRQLACVMTPRTVEALATTLRVAGETGTKVTVRGGGLSSNCVADHAVMVDLSAHFGAARRDGGNDARGAASVLASGSGGYRGAGRVRFGHSWWRRLPVPQRMSDHRSPRRGRTGPAVRCDGPTLPTVLTATAGLVTR